MGDFCRIPGGARRCQRTGRQTRMNGTSWPSRGRSQASAGIVRSLTGAPGAVLFAGWLVSLMFRLPQFMRPRVVVVLPVLPAEPPALSGRVGAVLAPVEALWRPWRATMAGLAAQVSGGRMPRSAAKCATRCEEQPFHWSGCGAWRCSRIRQRATEGDEREPRGVGR